MHGSAEVSATRRRLAALPLLLASLFAHPVVAAGQEDPEPTRFSLRLGVGFGAGGDIGGINVVREAALTRRPHRVAFRATALTPILVPISEREFTGYALTYGRAVHRERLHASFGVGVSRLEACAGRWPSQVRDHCDGTWGIPLVADGGIHVWAVGVGIEVFANLNRLDSYGGLNAYLSFGWPP
jgi:hypothetical protein